MQIKKKESNGMVIPINETCIEGYFNQLWSWKGHVGGISGFSVNIFEGFNFHTNGSLSKRN